MTTPAYLEQQISDHADDPLLYLLTIAHDDLPEPMRFVRNHVDIVSRGMTFTAFPFDFVRPGDGENGPSRARLAIDNVDRRIVEAVRSLATPPVLVIEVILASAPDTVQETFQLFRLTTVSADRFTVEGELVDVDDDEEPLTAWAFTPGFAPAIHN